MQSDDTIQRTFVLLMISQIMGLVFVIILLSNNAFAQSLHDRTLYEMVKQTPEVEKNSQIDVGRAPAAIAVDIDNGFTNTIYVANSGSDTVSIINGNDNTKIGEDIAVGESPRAIADIGFTNTIYVAQIGGINVIDSVTNKVVAGITFQINPFNSGYILCDDMTTPSPTSQYFYVYSGDECTAKPNEGFEFVSWEENLGGNSTQLIKLSRPASTWDSFLEFLRIKSPDEPEANLTITKFGSFTANFKELPPPVPPEFWLQSYVLVGTVIAGLSIPSIVSWIKSKMDARKLNYYHKKIASLYGDDDKLDENDIEPLNQLRSSILDAYSKGKINEKHYESLKNETSILYEKIFRNRINDSLNNNNSPSNAKTTEEQLAQIRNELEYAYSEEKLNEKHYTNLVNNISMLYQEVFKKEIDSLNSLTNNEDKMQLLNKLHSDIEDAYSKEKVTEKHYNLLKEKISDYENRH